MSDQIFNLIKFIVYFVATMSILCSITCYIFYKVKENKEKRKKLIEEKTWEVKEMINSLVTPLMRSIDRIERDFYVTDYFHKADFAVNKFEKILKSEAVCFQKILSCHKEPVYLYTTEENAKIFKGTIKRFEDEVRKYKRENKK